ncbi:MAG: hypothetical protein GY866_03345 [Proteobacteria bacterium]|nr:hypothetical protein [Pseudomonadota bacterium]
MAKKYLEVFGKPDSSILFLRLRIEGVLQEKSLELGRYSPPVLAPGAEGKLMVYNWPGNVRELENTVERALIINRGAFLDFPDLMKPEITTPVSAQDKKVSGSLLLDEMVFHHIENVMVITGGRVNGRNGAAELLGLKPGTLRHRMRKLGMPFGRKTRKGKRIQQDPKTTSSE